MNDTDARQQVLREKLEHARESLGEGALPAVPLPDAEPPEGYVALAMEYPFAAIAGGLAIGLLAGSLLPRGVGRRIAQGTVAAAALAGRIGRDYGTAALDRASTAAEDAGREGRQKFGELGSRIEALGQVVGSQTRRVSREAADKTSSAVRDSRQKGLDLGYRLAREAIKFASHLRH